VILIGEADEANPAERCREIVVHARPDGAPIAPTVYPGAHHGFDVAQLTLGIRYLGPSMEYNKAAAKDAEEKVLAFLAAHLGRAATEKPDTQ